MKIVKCLPNGIPVEEQYLNYPRYFDGNNLLIFEDLAEFDSYVRNNLDDSTKKESSLETGLFDKVEPEGIEPSSETNII